MKLLNHHVVTELMLIDVLMNNMMERISDPCCTVRMLAIRGLGNIAVGSPEKVERSLAFTSAQEPQLHRPLLLPSLTRWINMPRSCWQPWVRAWRRRMIQVTWQRRLLINRKMKSYLNLVWLFWFIALISHVYTLLVSFFPHHNHMISTRHLLVFIRRNVLNHPRLLVLLQVN